MNSAPSSAATKRSGWKTPAVSASAVPTSTGASPTGSVFGRAAISQMRTTLGLAVPVLMPTSLRPPRKAREVGRALLEEGRASLGRLLAAVEEEVRVVGELLDAGVAVLLRVEAGLHEPQRKGGKGKHLAAPLHRRRLQLLQRHDRVDQPHLQRLLRAVLPAQKPDLLGLLGANEVAQHRRAEAPVPRANSWPRLPEARVVGRDRQVAHDVEDMPATDRIARHHRHDRLWQPADLHMEVRDVKAPDRRVPTDSVTRLAPHSLVAARAERLVALAGEDDRAHRCVLPRPLERVGQLDHRLRPKRVAHLRPVDRDLRDPVAAQLVADVLVLTGRRPRHAHVSSLLKVGGPEPYSEPLAGGESPDHPNSADLWAPHDLKPAEFRPTGGSPCSLRGSTVRLLAGSSWRSASLPR